MRKHLMAREKMTVVALGIPGLSSVRCTLDRDKGTVHVVRRSFLKVERDEFPLRSVDKFYARRVGMGFGARYSAVFTFRHREEIKIHATTGRQAKAAIRRFRAFIDEQSAR